MTMAMKMAMMVMRIHDGVVAECGVVFMMVHVSVTNFSVVAFPNAVAAMLLVMLHGLLSMPPLCNVPAMLHKSLFKVMHGKRKRMAMVVMIIHLHVVIKLEVVVVVVIVRMTIYIEFIVGFVITPRICLHVIIITVNVIVVVIMIVKGITSSTMRMLRAFFEPVFGHHIFTSLVLFVRSSACQKAPCP